MRACLGVEKYYSMLDFSLMKIANGVGGGLKN